MLHLPIVPIFHKLWKSLTLVTLVVATSGCLPSFVGTKISYSTPLHTVSSDAKKRSQSHYGASEFGVSIQNELDSNIVLVIDPTISSTFRDNVTLMISSNYRSTTISTAYNLEYSLFKFPVIVQYSRPIMNSIFSPYIGLGLQFNGVLSSQLSGVVSELDSTLKPIRSSAFAFTERETSSKFWVPLDILASTGVGVHLSHDWLLVMDARLQSSLGLKIGIDSNSDTEFSLLHLTTSVSMLLRL